MVTKDLKKLLEKLNDHCTRALETAAGFCIARGHYEVSLEHLLLKLLEDGTGDVPHILDHFSVDRGTLWAHLLARLEEYQTGNTGRPSFSPLLMQLAEAAWIVASVHHGYPKIRSGHLLEALLESDRYRLNSVADDLASVQSGQLRQHFMDIVAGSVEDKPVLRAGGPRAARTPERDGETALDLYTLNMTGRAQAARSTPSSRATRKSVRSSTS